MGKIFNAVLKNRLTEWVERTEILPESQFGFRKDRRTTDCIFILNALTEQVNISKTNLFICFVDFRKAFDSVYRPLLPMEQTNLTGHQSTDASNTAIYVH